MANSDTAQKQTEPSEHRFVSDWPSVRLEEDRLAAGDDYGLGGEAAPYQFPLSAR